MQKAIQELVLFYGLKTRQKLSYLINKKMHPLGF